MDEQCRLDIYYPENQAGFPTVVWFHAGNGVDANDIAGLIPFSGQTVTHSTIRAERGIPRIQVTVDKLAPLYHVRADSPPLVLITGDRELEIWGVATRRMPTWRV